MLAGYCWTLKRDVPEANYRESHTPVHFRGKILSVSLVRKVLFCTNTALCIFETLPDKNSVYVSEFSINSTAKFTY